MPWWQMIVLAAVQGIAEFLPISSSGHIVVLGELFKVKELLELNIVLHLGTLGSILVFYRRRIWELITVHRRVIPLLIYATIPAVLVGLPLKKYGESILESALVAGPMFVVTGLAVLYLSRRNPKATGDYPQMTWQRAVWIGLSQAAAILPGLSRSGSTMATGVATGLSRPAAAAFSFLMAIPVIAGAGVLEARHLLDPATVHLPALQLLTGALIAFVVGIGALTVLNRWLEAGQMHWFGYYCIGLGLVVTTWQVSLLLA